MDSDDASSAKHIIDDIDNFAMISSAKGNGKCNKAMACKAANQNTTSCLHPNNVHTNERGSGGSGNGGGCEDNGTVVNGDNSVCRDLNCCNADVNSPCMDVDGHCTEVDCQGNYADTSLCECGMNNFCGEGGTMAGGGKTKGNPTICRLYSNKELNENTINRLQAMAMSDDDDYGKWPRNLICSLF